MERFPVLSLLAGVVVAAPLAAGLRVPVQPSAPTAAAFAAVESIPAGARVLLAVDYGPDAAAEGDPIAAAFLRHALARECRVILVSLWVTGGARIARVVEAVAREVRDGIYGRDLLDLGFKAGGPGAVAALASDFAATFPTDVHGADLRAIEIVSGIDTIRDVDLIVAVGAGEPGPRDWIRFAGDASGVPVVAGVTAAEAPFLRPYWPGQLRGLVAGVRGAAEYEVLLAGGYPGRAPAEVCSARRLAAAAAGDLLVISVIGAGALAEVRRRIRGALRRDR